MTKKVRNIVLDQTLDARLVTMAKEEYLSVNAFVNKLIRDAYNAHSRVVESELPIEIPGDDMPTFDGYTESPELTHSRWENAKKTADLWLATHCWKDGTVLIEETRPGTTGDDAEVYSICPKCGLEQ